MPTGRERLRLVMLRAWAASLRPLRPDPGPPTPAEPRILVMRPDHLGDLLFTGPALWALRAAFPKAQISALVGPWGQGIAQRLPGVDRVLTCSFPGFARAAKGSPLAPYRLLFQEARRLRDFDVAVILRFDHWWGALLSYVAGIPQRWGYAIPECRPFLTKAISYTRGRHEVLQNLRLIQETVPDGAAIAQDDLSLAFQVTRDEEASALRCLAQHDVKPNEPLIGIHPGAGAVVKLWPAARYAQVADSLAQEYGARIVITGSQAELGLAWKVAAAMEHDPIMAAGETTLGQLAALMAECRLVIGSDSGPLHLAVAMGTPTLHMYGPADPIKFGPWAPGEEDRHSMLRTPLACAPCERLDYAVDELDAHGCMGAISVQDVLGAARSILGS